jgi:hypothetical protein
MPQEITVAHVDGRVNTIHVNDSGSATAAKSYADAAGNSATASASSASAAADSAVASAASALAAGVSETNAGVSAGVASNAAALANEAAVSAAAVAYTGYTTRASLVGAVSLGLVPDNGRQYDAGGLSYLGQTGATSISDLPGLVPAGLSNVAHYGAIEGTDTANAAINTAAARAMMDAERTVRFPGGDWVLNDRLVSTSPKNIVGEGMMVSRVRWTDDATAEGIKIVSGDDWGTSSVKGVSLLTAKEGVGTALEIDYSGNIDGGVIAPRARKHALIENVHIEGSPLYTDAGWDKHIKIVSALGVDVRGCRIVGYGSGADGSLPDSTSGIEYSGAGSPTTLSVSQTLISKCLYGIDTADAEGVYVSVGVEIVNCGTAVRVVNAGSEPALHLIGIHCASLVANVDLTNVADFKIIGCSLFAYGTVDSDFYGVIVRAGCTNGLIDGNTFIRPNSTALYKGVEEIAGTRTVIRNNHFVCGSSVGCIGINIGASSVAADYSVGNAFSTSCNVHIVDASTDKENRRIIHIPLRTNAVQVSHTGDTNETTLATITIPAKWMGPNGFLRVRAEFGNTNNGNNKTFRIRFDGSIIFSTVQTSSIAHRYQIEIANRGAENSQMIGSGSGGGFGSVGFAATTTAINTALDKNLTFTVQLANGSDTAFLERIVVELFKQA